MPYRDEATRKAAAREYWQRPEVREASAARKRARRLTTPGPEIKMLTCQLEECGRPFIQTYHRASKHCSIKCRSRARYLAKSNPSRRNTGVRAPKRQVRRPRDEARKAYDREYMRRPEVRERNRLRAAAVYTPHPRPPSLAGRRIDGEVPAPYIGHRWLEMAREAAGQDLDRSRGETAEWRQDEMGEALLALMEARDPKEAVKAYRKSEFTARYLTKHLSEWSNGDEDASWRLDVILPSVPSAEDEVVARETVTRVFRKHLYHHGVTKRSGGSGNRQQQPSQRRMKDAGWRKYAA